MLGLSLVFGLPSISSGATVNVTAGCTDPVKCANGVGFVDDLTGVGGSGVLAPTALVAGDTVHWHLDAGGVHTITSQAAPGAGAAAPCGTGDSFDSGFLFAPTAVFDRVFPTPGTCSYFCLAHGAGQMQGTLTIAGGGGVTTTIGTVTTTIGGGPTTTAAPVTTTVAPVTTTTAVPVTTTVAPVTTTVGPGTTSTTFNPNPTTTIVASTTTILQTSPTIRNGNDGRGGGNNDGRGGGNNGGRGGGNNGRRGGGNNGGRGGGGGGRGR
jgi:plastocyanin